MKKVFNSLFMAALLSMWPVWGAIDSQYISQNFSTTPDAEEVIWEKIPVEQETSEADQTPAKLFILRQDTIIVYDDEIPYEVQYYANIYGDKYGICPELLEAIAFHESRYTEDAVNGLCIGLMQINTKVHRERIESLGLSDRDITTTEGSIQVAASYLKELFKEDEDPAVVLMRYNGDSAGLEKFRQTGSMSSYAASVLSLSEELERRHGK